MVILLHSYPHLEDKNLSRFILHEILEVLSLSHLGLLHWLLLLLAMTLSCPPWFVQKKSLHVSIKSVWLTLTSSSMPSQGVAYFSYYLSDWTNLITLLLLFSRQVVFDSLQPNELQHTRLPCPSLSPRVWLMSTELMMPSNHLILCLHLLLPPSIFPSLRIFSKEWLFMSGGQSIGASASASVLPINIQGRW